MDADTRRSRILEMLRADLAVTGASFASQLGVSRQVIVQDMAILRAQGHPIMATSRGYMLLRDTPTKSVSKLFAVKHTKDQTRDELYAIVDLGAEVVDVTVEHPIYGQLTGMLSLSTRGEVDQFLDAIERTRAGLLSSLTKGVHLHTVSAADWSIIQAVSSVLLRKGYLLSE